MDIFRDQQARGGIEELFEKLETLSDRLEHLTFRFNEANKPPKKQLEEEVKELRTYCDNLLKRLGALEANQEHHVFNQLRVMKIDIEELKRK